MLSRNNAICKEKYTDSWAILRPLWPGAPAVLTTFLPVLGRGNLEQCCSPGLQAGICPHFHDVSGEVLRRHTFLLGRDVCQGNASACVFWSVLRRALSVSLLCRSCGQQLPEAQGHLLCDLPGFAQSRSPECSLIELEP